MKYRAIKEIQILRGLERVKKGDIGRGRGIGFGGLLRGYDVLDRLSGVVLCCADLTIIS